MNTIFKNRLLSTIVVLLLLANMAAMGFFWWQRFMDDEKGIARRDGLGASAFLIDKLKFDSVQLIAFKKLLMEHQEKITLGKDSMHLAKDRFFDLLEKDNVTEQELQSGASFAAMQQIKLDRITYDFFKSVQSICTPSQKLVFKDVIREALRIMGRPKPPPGKGSDHIEPQDPLQEGPPMRPQAQVGNGQMNRPLNKQKDKQKNGLSNDAPDASDKQGPPRPEERLAMTMQKINQEINLNATQQEKVKDAYAKFFQEMEKLHRQEGEPMDGPPAEPSAVEREARMKFEKIRNQKIESALSAEQYSKYKELEKTMRPPRNN